MKRLLLLVLAILAAIYTAESVDTFGFSRYAPRLEAAFVANGYILTWPRLFYPGYYEIEVLKAPPSGQEPTGPAERILTFRTFRNSFAINETFPYRTYWRISAHGLFRHPLGAFSNHLDLAEVMGQTPADFQRIKPILTRAYPADDPASEKPILTWNVITGAVYYEIEFLTQPPENPNGTEPSKHRFTFSREVFTNGYNADLSTRPENNVWWRVRALDYDGHPIGVFSDAQQIFIDHKKPASPVPLINCVFNQSGAPAPLYPVYSWIPITGAVSYEIEVLDAPPENPNGAEPSGHRIWSKEVTGFACYDDEPRSIPGVYYWRVRGLDAASRPVSAYSNAGQYTVGLQKNIIVATFGDSITHGGGGVSYSPADLEYSFQTYLNFPVYNLGRSGDTSETMVERFERDVLPFRPKYLLIMGGTNSLRGGIAAEKVIEDLAAVRAKCQARGIRPIFLTLPPINPDAIKKVFNEETAANWRQEFDTVNNFIRQQRYHIDLDPHLAGANRELPDYYAIDGLHPDIEGKKLIAHLINFHWAAVTR